MPLSGQPPNSATEPRTERIRRQDLTFLPTQVQGRWFYLYLILAIAVAWTVWNAGQILYGFLRLALLGARSPAGWSGVLSDLGDPLPAALAHSLERQPSHHRGRQPVCAGAE